MKARHFLILVILCATAAVIYGCRPRNVDSNLLAEDTSQTITDYWLGKVARHLLDRRLTREEAEQFTKLASKSAVIDRMMSMPEFELTAAKLTLNYLGHLNDASVSEIKALIQNPSAYINYPANGLLKRWPQILPAVKNLITDQDYLSLFRPTQPELYYEPSASTSRFSRSSGGESLKNLKADTNSVPTFTDAGFFTEFPNTFINRNRKRSKYILETFFCENLTPIEIEIPKMNEGKHGSQIEHLTRPQCFACHYKLDPMGGFLRNQGARMDGRGNPYELRFSQGEAVRDSTEIAKYFSTWKQGENLNVGFIRSAYEKNRNEYGSSLEDLFRIMRSVPETKKCMSKKFVEYFVTAEQAYSLKWFSDMTDQFIAAAQKNPEQSAVAVKNLIKDILTSNLYANPNPKLDRCYDPSESSGYECRINFILEKNCTSCHSAGHASAGLDLSSFERRENGEVNFSHKPRANGGKQLSALETFVRMEKAMQLRTSADSESGIKPMPLNQSMDQLEREELYLWIKGRSEELKK